MNGMLFVTRPKWSEIAPIVSKRIGKFYAANYVLQIASGSRTNKQVETILRELGVMRDQIPEADGEVDTNALPSPSVVVYPAADAENLERLHSDLKNSLDEQVRLLAQRRRLAIHLHAALKKRHLAEGMVSMMNDQVRQARAATAAAEQRLDHSEQMQESLTEDLQAAYSYRGSAIVRATAAEARAAAAERALTQVLNAQHPTTTLFSRLWSRLVSRTSEVTA